MPASSTQACDWHVIDNVDEEPSRFLGEWTKWSRKLLDHRYLQGFWSNLGYLLKHIKAVRSDRLRVAMSVIYEEC